MKDWILIVNPNSASKATARTWEAAKQRLIDGGLEVDHVCTEGKGHAIELAIQSASKGYRRIISMGGDGTIHEVMTGLLRYADANPGTDLGDFTLGVIPAGTGNDWIRTSGIPYGPAEATSCIIQGKTEKEDVVRMTLESGVFCMANIGGIGLDADICQYTNALKDKGIKGSLLYKLLAPYAILSKKRMPVEIVCDGVSVYKGKLFSAVLANGIFRGGGVKQNAPGVSWSDGLLDVSIMPGVSHLKAIILMTHALKGDFATVDGIITTRCRKMTVTPLDKRKADNVESDGEVPGKLPLTVEITGQQINIIVP